MHGPARIAALAVPGECLPGRERWATAVREAAEAEARGEGEPRPPLVTEADSQFAVWLRLLTYCYANGVYASADIEWELSHDPVLRELANGQRHESGEIRSFRRRHRLALERCLARALAAGWDQTRAVPGGAKCIPRGYAGCSLERGDGQARIPDFDKVAAERLREAICSDTAVLDE